MRRGVWKCMVEEEGESEIEKNGRKKNGPVTACGSWGEEKWKKKMKKGNGSTRLGMGVGKKRKKMENK